MRHTVSNLFSDTLYLSAIVPLMQITGSNTIFIAYGSVTAEKTAHPIH